MRTGGRLALTAAGRRAVETAEAMERASADFERRLAEDEGEAEGVVRVTALGSILNAFVTPGLPALRLRRPALRLELIAEARNLSISRQEADIAIRLARPSGADIARKLATISYAIYGAADGPWIGYDESLASTPNARWVADHVPARAVWLRANRLSVVAGAVGQGLGQALLPTFAARWLPLAGATVLSREAWMLLHRDTRRAPRIRAVADWQGRRGADGAAPAHVCKLRLSTGSCW